MKRRCGAYLGAAITISKQAGYMVTQAGKNGLPETLDKPGNMDIHAVARLANVSISTVSRSINKASAVNPKTAKRVWQAIAKLNYFPNTQARAVVSGAQPAAGLDRFRDHLPGSNTRV